MLAALRVSQQQKLNEQIVCKRFNTFFIQIYFRFRGRFGSISGEKVVAQQKSDENVG